jgi:eukaryotic-like serine/threonine-protein kinase
MPEGNPAGSSIRFGVFEVDLEAGELRKRGLRIKLPDQPFQVLAMLLERPGQVVTRDELQGRLWAADTFVDFDRGLNKAMNRLREALGDVADDPRFIETLPKRGYRFIMALETGKLSAVEVGVAQPLTQTSVADSAMDVGLKPAVHSVALAGLGKKLLWGIVLLAAGLAFLTLPYFRSKPGSEELMRSSLLPPPNTSFLPYNFAVSPDGTRLVFAAVDADGKNMLWVRALSGTAAQQLTGTEGASLPFWSPDNRQIGFFADSKLKAVDIAGGAMRVLSESPIPRGGTWNSDGLIVFAPDITGPLYRVSATGGVSTQVTGISGAASWPFFLPDGKHFLFSLRSAPGASAGSGIFAGSLDSDDLKAISSEGVGNVAFASNQLFFVRDGTLAAQPFDPSRLRTIGPSVPIAERELETEPVFSRSGFSISQTGVLVFQSSSDFGSHLTWIDPLGKELGLVPHVGFREPSLSPDGRLLAVSCDEQHNGKRDICVLELARGVLTRLTDGGADKYPVWSRDGRVTTYSSSDGKSSHIYQVAADGSNPPRLLPKARGVPTGWSPDAHLLSMGVDGGNVSVLVFSASDYQTTSLGRGSEGQFSPDGQWIVHGGPSGIVVLPFPGPGAHIQISNAGAQPRWSRNGGQIFYIAPDKKLMAVNVDPTKKGISAPRALFQTRIIATGLAGFQYDIALDGRFLINSLPSSSSPLTLVTGWTSLLKR